MSDKNHCISLYVDDDLYNKINNEANDSKISKSKYLINMYNRSSHLVSNELFNSHVLQELTDLKKLVKKLYSLEMFHLVNEKFTNIISVKDSNISSEFEHLYRKDKIDD